MPKICQGDFIFQYDRKLVLWLGEFRGLIWTVNGGGYQFLNGFLKTRGGGRGEGGGRESPLDFMPLLSLTSLRVALPIVSLSFFDVVDDQFWHFWL